MDYISIDNLLLCYSELVSYCNTTKINIIVVLVLACHLINLILLIQHITRTWRPEQIDQIKEIIRQNIPQGRRRDKLYIKLGYQYASNTLKNEVLPYNSVMWKWHSVPPSNDPYLTSDEKRRVRRAVDRGISHQDPDANEFKVNRLRVYYKNDPERHAPTSSPQFMSLISRYDI